MTGVLHAARISTVEVIVSVLIKLIKTVNFKLGNEIIL